MGKSLFEQMGGTYRKSGDYYLPNLVLPAQKEIQVLGKYGRMRLRYIKEHHKVVYINLLTSGELAEHLHDVDIRAKTQIEEIVKAFAKADGCDENLKSTNQMKWVGLMNNYTHCAEEIVLKDVVFE
jgi:hypothetical protein